MDDDTLTAIVRVSNDHGEKIKDIEQYMCSDDEVGVRVEGSYVSSTADRYSLRGRGGDKRRVVRGDSQMAQFSELHFM